jgi:tripartite-type tricarboxylate transporter receptor subunit TctC
MHKRTWSAILGCALIFVGISANKAAAQEQKVEDFYRGATINFIVPFGPGGSYDLWARKLAPYLEKHTGANVIVENKFRGYPAIDYLSHTAKPDGLTIQISGMAGLVLGKMLGSPDSAKSDIEKLNYLGRVSVEERALFTSKASGLKSITEMQKSAKPIRFSSQGGAADSAVDSALISAGFGLNANIGTGSPGSAEDLVYLAEGKKDAKCSTWSADFREAVKKGNLNLILFLGKKGNADYRQVPAALSAPGIVPGGKKYLELDANLVEAGRMIFTAPGVPEGRVLFLEKALANSMKEPGLLDWAKKDDVTIAYLSGKECKAWLTGIMGLVPLAERAELKHIVFEKYY